MDSLFELVKSLSRSEKRHFKLMCTRQSSGGNYLKLYEAIDAQQEYDEAAIREKFKGQKFTRQLHVTKAYLQKLILRSLREFHSNISKESEVRDLLRNTEILFNKELFKQCVSQLNRAGRIAEEFELLPLLFSVLSWQKKVEQAINPHNYIRFSEIIAKRKDVVARMENLNIHWESAVSISRSMFGSRPGAADLPKLEEPKESPDSLEALVLLQNSRYLLALQNQGETEARNHLEELVVTLEKYPNRVEEDPSMYTSTINNLLSYLVYNRNHDDAIRLIEKTKSVYESWNIKSENRSLFKQVLRTYNIELEIYRDQKSFEENLNFIERTEEFVIENVNKIPKDYLVSFWFQFASIHFMRKDYSRAMHWVNHLLHKNIKGYRTDLQLQARMLNLMIHFEQRNMFVLRYFVDSTKRFMKKLRAVTEFENLFLKFFVKVGKVPESEYPQLRKELGAKLFPPSGESLIPTQLQGYIDYEAWVMRTTTNT